MKNALMLLLALGTAATTQATVIQWHYSNDIGGIADASANDGLYTGIVDLVQMNDGSYSFTDALVGKYAVVNVNTDMFYISNSNTAVASTAVFSGNFNLDLTSANLSSGSGYVLKNVAVNNTIGSGALTEFANVLSVYPDAMYTFSMQGSFGNGQVGTLPEPSTMGLLGLGLIGISLVARRKKTA